MMRPKQPKMKPKITITFDERQSPPQVSMYGENFRALNNFNEATENIYQHFLHEQNLLEAQISKTTFYKPSEQKPLIYKQTITCDGKITDDFLKGLGAKGINIHIDKISKKATHKVLFMDYNVLLPANTHSPAKKPLIQIVTIKKTKQEVISEPMIVTKSKLNETFRGYISEYLESVGKPPLKMGTRNKINRKPGDPRKEYCFYSPGATKEEFRKAIDYANTPCKISISHKFTAQDLATSLRRGLVFQNKEVVMQGNETAAKVRTGTIGSTSLALDNKEIYHDSDIKLIADAIAGLATRAYQKTHEPFTITVSGRCDDIERALLKIDEHKTNMPPVVFDNMRITVERSNQQINSILEKMGKKPLGQKNDTGSSSVIANSTTPTNFKRRSGSF